MPSKPSAHVLDPAPRGSQLFHGSTHPYPPGADVVPGKVGGSSAEYDPRLRVWVCDSADDAARWAAQRPCGCGGRDDHQPRVFEVEAFGLEVDPNVMPPHVSWMAKRAVVIEEFDMPAAAFQRW